MTEPRTTVQISPHSHVFLGAGQMTGMFRDTALTETRCRSRGDSACVYEFAF